MYRYQGGDDGLVVGLAPHEGGRLLADVSVAPLAKRGERQEQIVPLPGEPVFVALSLFAGADTLEDAFVDQPVQSAGVDPGRNTGGAPPICLL